MQNIVFSPKNSEKLSEKNLLKFDKKKDGNVFSEWNFDQF